MQPGEALERGADRAVVADDELLTGLGPPADVGGARGQNACQPPVEQAVGHGGDAQPVADTPQERRDELGAPFRVRDQPGGASGGRRGEGLSNAVRHRVVERRVGGGAPPHRQRCGHGDDHVGGDSPTTADFAPRIGLEDRRGVFRGAGSPREAQVLLVSDAAVAALDEAAVRCEHPSNRQPDVIARREEEDRLHERLAEAAAPPEQGGVMVLEGAGEPFGGARVAQALAGSLQDHDRALLVGRRSFGKALMQSIFFLPSGDHVWLTIGRVLTPNGRFIQRRYRGIGYEQYLSFAGRSGAAEDTSTIFKTDAGREVRGGGGIVPDVVVPVTAPLPVWWSAAADSALDDAVSDSVAQTLTATPAGRAAWLIADAEWRAKLVPPFLGRVRNRLGVAAVTDSLLDRRLARILAARAADVRWGPEAREEFIVRNDGTIRAAFERFPRLHELLAPKPQ